MRQKKRRDHRKTRRKAAATKALIWQRHQTTSRATPEATYHVQHPSANNHQIETSCYKGEHSSSILHRDNVQRKNPESESPTEQGGSSTHEAWRSSTPTRPARSHERCKSTRYHCMARSGRAARPPAC